MPRWCSLPPSLFRQLPRWRLQPPSLFQYGAGGLSVSPAPKMAPEASLHCTSYQHGACGHTPCSASYKDGARRLTACFARYKDGVRGLPPCQVPRWRPKLPSLLPSTRYKDGALASLPSTAPTLSGGATHPVRTHLTREQKPVVRRRHLREPTPLWLSLPRSHRQGSLPGSRGRG